MGKWGGIIGSAVLGGIAGGAQAVGALAQQQMASDEFDRRSAIEEAKAKRVRLLEQEHAARMQADSQAFQAGQSDEQRRFSAEQSSEDRNLRSMESDKQLGHSASENEKNRKNQRELEGMREGAADRRLSKSLAATRGEDRQIQVLDENNNLRSVTPAELNDPNKKYRPVAASGQDQRTNSAQMNVEAANIRSQRQATTQMPTKENKEKLANMERAFEQRYGQKAGAPAGAAPGASSIDDLISLAVKGN